MNKIQTKYPLHNLNWIYMPVVVDNGIYGYDCHCCSNCSSLFFYFCFYLSWVLGFLTSAVCRRAVWQSLWMNVTLPSILLLEKQLRFAALPFSSKILWVWHGWYFVLCFADAYYKTFVVLEVLLWVWWDYIFSFDKLPSFGLSGQFSANDQK